MSDSRNSPERCVLCLDQKRSPVRIQCGHSFCCGCLDVYKSYKKYPWASKCPICRHVLKEKRKPTKRKYSELNSDSHNATTNSATEVRSDSSPTENQNQSRQSNILEEFMTLAANYYDDSQEDNSFHDYEALDEAVQYITQDNETHYDEEYEEFQYNDTYEDELNFYTDSEENYDDDNYNLYYYFEDHENAYEPPRPRRHINSFYYDSDEETSYIDVVDDSVAYEADNFDVDWETVIASDVIIID